MSASETTPATPLVSILVVTYNSADEIDRCLDSVASSVGVPHEIVIVDNLSNDDTVRAIRSSPHNTRLIVNDTNAGFAAAVNKAAAAADGEFLLLLNPDTEMKRGCVEALLDAERRVPRGGLYGGRCVHEDGSLEPSSCWGAPTLWSEFCFATGLSTAFRDSALFDPQAIGGWQRDSEREVGVITGCLLLCRAIVWEELKGFDETYWLYGEDTDLTDRARAAGYAPMITPHAEIIHHIGASSSNVGWRTARIMQGKVTFQVRRRPGLSGRIGVFLLLAGTWLRARRLFARLTRSQGNDWAFVWAERDSWRHGY